MDLYVVDQGEKISFFQNRCCICVIAYIDPEEDSVRVCRITGYGKLKIIGKNISVEDDEEVKYERKLETLQPAGI